MRFIFLFFCFVPISSSAQTLSKKQEAAIRSELGNFNKINGETFENNLGRRMFCFIGKDTFVNPDGFHFLFKLQNDTIIRLDHSIFHGANFGRYLFTYNKNIYLLGGYGLFNTNNNLETFNWETQEWVIEKTDGEKPPYIFSGITFKNENFIYTFNNFKGNNNVEPNVLFQDVYKLDLNNKKWTRFENINTAFLDPTISTLTSANFYLKDYILNIRGVEVKLIKTATLQYIQSNIEQWNILQNQTEAYSFRIENNSISYIRIGSSSIKHQFLNINFDSIFTKNIHLAKVLILEPSWFQVACFQKWPIVIFILILISALLFLFIKKWGGIIKTPVVIAKSNGKNGIEAIIAKIKASINKELTIDELDVLLGIFHLELESRKLKRHRLLHDIDIKSPNLISRTKDVIDKRKYLYIIQKKQSDF